MERRPPGECPVPGGCQAPQEKGSLWGRLRLFGWSLGKCRPLLRVARTAAVVLSPLRTPLDFVRFPRPAPQEVLTAFLGTWLRRRSCSCGVLAAVGACGSVQSWHPAVLLGSSQWDCCPPQSILPWSCSQGPGLGMPGSSQLGSLHSSLVEWELQLRLVSPPPPKDHTGISCMLCPG